MANTEMSVEQLLWLQAAHYLRREPNIRQALSVLKNSTDLSWRVSLFDFGLVKMRQTLDAGPADPDFYRNLNQYAALKAVEPVLSLEELTNMYQADLPLEPVNPIRQGINRTWLMMRYYIARGEPGFAFARTTKDPFKLLSGLLIEGCGLLMENLLDTPSLRPIFVRAYEEVLIDQDPASILLRDILDWMVEDKSYFAPGTREKIEHYHHLRGN